MDYVKWNKYHNFNKLQILLKKLRDKLYLLTRKLINNYYLPKLKLYPELYKFTNDLSKRNKKSCNLSDVLALYEDVLKLKPNYILELGPGTSTIAICLAIAQLKIKDKKYNPIFYAVESRKEWLDYHINNLPKGLAENVNLILREEMVTNFKNKKLAYYKDIPLLPYELIHVDGPDIHGLGVDFQKDLIDLEPCLPYNCKIIFDGRRNAARFSRKIMKNFNFRRDSRTLNHIISRKKIENAFFLDFLKPY